MSFIHVISPETLKHNIIFLGNPGSGKSTWLNNLAGRREDGEIKFQAGVKHGSRLTTALQAEETDGVIYSDTPGLADPAIRERAAEEIKKGLSQNGSYSVVFFFTVSGGRMPPAEVTTMDTILKLCPPLRCCHAIVCNKLSKKEYSDLHKMEGEAWENMKAQLVMKDDAGNVLPVTKHTFGKRVDDLEDEDDRLLDDVPEDFRRFVQNGSQDQSI